MTPSDSSPHSGRRATRMAALVCLLWLLALLPLAFATVFVMDIGYFFILLFLFLVLSPAALLHAWILWRLRPASSKTRGATILARVGGVLVFLFVLAVMLGLWTSAFREWWIYAYFGALALANSVLAALAFRARIG